MRKLTLKLDALKVDTFQVTPGAEPSRGTVRGHDVSEWPWACYTGSDCTVMNCSGDCASNGCVTAETCAGGGPGCPASMDNPTV